MNPKVASAMVPARTLVQQKISVIVSAWSPPRWARATSQPPGLRGTALDLDKLDRICASLASYLVFLKEYCGVEAVFFSFNEPETEWQLTTDYSVLTGIGIYGEDGPLRPTQRFWNLKQLGSPYASSGGLPRMREGWRHCLECQNAAAHAF
jgi:hypothetical protein